MHVVKVDVETKNNAVHNFICTFFAEKHYLQLFYVSAQKERSWNHFQGLCWTGSLLYHFVTFFRVIVYNFKILIMNHQEKFFINGLRNMAIRIKRCVKGMAIANL